MADYANEQGMSDIESLLKVAHASGEWVVDHDAILARWRAARGQAAMGSWSWWVKPADDDLYANECASREEAIAWARNEYPGEALKVIEARCWDDEIEGEEEFFFAESRNEEVIPAEVVS